MSIEATTTKTTPKAEYPCLMVHISDVERHDPLVALFTGKNTGIIVSVNEGTDQQIGQDAHACFGSNVEPYFGTVTLRNK